MTSWISTNVATFLFFQNKKWGTWSVETEHNLEWFTAVKMFEVNTEDTLICKKRRLQNICIRTTLKTPTTINPHPQLYGMFYWKQIYLEKCWYAQKQACDDTHWAVTKQCPAEWVKGEAGNRLFWERCGVELFTFLFYIFLHFENSFCNLKTFKRK